MAIDGWYSTHHMRIPLLIEHFNIIELDVEELVYGFECADEAEIVLQLDCARRVSRALAHKEARLTRHRLLCECFEDRENELECVRGF